jgi:multidrug resistance efflux pump
VVAGLGVVLFASSVVIAVVALRSHAGTPETAPAEPPAPQRALHGVAVGHVDVEPGITPLSPMQPGRVVKIDAKEGETVEAGAVLLTLDDTLAKLQEDEARIAVKAAKVRLEEAQSLESQHAQRIEAQEHLVAAAKEDVKLAKVAHEKAQKRFKNGTGSSREDVESAELVMHKAEAAVKAEEARLAGLRLQKPARAAALAANDLEAKEVELKKATQIVNEHVLRAPCAGAPLRIFANVGEPLGPAAKQPALLFCPTGPRIVRAEVEQEFAGRVSKDQKVRIVDDATAGGNWTGKVLRTSDWYTQRRSVLMEPLQFNDVRTLECIITLDPNQPSLRIGQRVRVFFE